MKVEPTETLEENVGRSSAPAPVSKQNVARPPRPDRPVPVVQAVKRKGTTEGPEQRSEKSRREELLEMALMKSGMNLSPATGGNPSRIDANTAQSTLPAEISPLQGYKDLQVTAVAKLKGASPLQKFQIQKKPPLPPKPPMGQWPSQPNTNKPAVTTTIQTSLNSKQIEALLSAPSIGSPTSRQAPDTPSPAGFSFANDDTPNLLNDSTDSSNRKRTGNVDSPGCNFSLECEVCKTQVI